MIPLYRNDSYLASHETIVDSLSEDGESHLLSFRETLFTQGGGQPRDHGNVSYGAHTRGVEDLVKHKGDIRIRVAAIPELKKGATVRCELDFERRFRIMRLHTVQHALAGALRKLRDDYQTAGMQIADDVSSCQMKFRTSGECSEKDVRAAFDIVGEAVRAGREVRAETFEGVEAATEKYGALYRPGDPSVKIKGKVRVIVIAELDVNACGGTHVKNTKEIGELEFLGLEQGAGENVLKFSLA